MFKYNDKVVPIDKSTSCSLEDSPAWEHAKKNGQNFLYFVGKGYGCLSEEYLCDNEPYSVHGDYFRLEDLVPYIEDNEIDEEMEFYVEVTLKSLNRLKDAGIINEDDLLFVRRA